MRNAVVFEPDGLPDLVQELHFVQSISLGFNPVAFMRHDYNEFDFEATPN